MSNIRFYYAKQGEAVVNSVRENLNLPFSGKSVVKSYNEYFYFPHLFHHTDHWLQLKETEYFERMFM